MKNLDSVIKVAIADDHALFRTGVKTSLSSRKEIQMIAEAENGMQLMNLLKHMKPDVVLLDIHMPIMDGYHTTKAIRERLGTPGAYIVAVSAMSDAASREAAFKAGVNDFLAKPWNTSDIRRILQKVCAIPEQARVTAA